MSAYSKKSTDIELKTDGSNLYSLNKNLKFKFDPKNITHIQHPNTMEKLNVVNEPTIQQCRFCESTHKIYVYELEKNYTACYCDNYFGGNWIFKKNWYNEI
jgi:hypothetical protein